MNCYPDSLTEALLQVRAARTAPNKQGLLCLFLYSCIFCTLILVLIGFIYIRHISDACSGTLLSDSQVVMFTSPVALSLNVTLFSGTLHILVSPDHYLHIKLAKQFNRMSFRPTVTLENDTLTIDHPASFFDDIFYCKNVDVFVYLPSFTYISALSLDMGYQLSGQGTIYFGLATIHNCSITTRKMALTGSDFHFDTCKITMYDSSIELDHITPFDINSSLTLISYRSLLNLQGLKGGHVSMITEIPSGKENILNISPYYHGSFDVQVDSKQEITMAGSDISFTRNSKTRKTGDIGGSGGESSIRYVGVDSISVLVE
ncbi:hypothetical protein GEMRC1_011426 [Eukaryota sp. GEM-RC1]